MKERGVAFCPTLSTFTVAKLGNGERKRAAFKAALVAGVTIASGMDVGVVAHGDNAKEIESMVDFGMRVIDALRSAPSVNAGVLHKAEQIGAVKVGRLV